MSFCFYTYNVVFVPHLYVYVYVSYRRRIYIFAYPHFIHEKSYTYNTTRTMLYVHDITCVYVYTTYIHIFISSFYGWDVMHWRHHTHDVVRAPHLKCICIYDVYTYFHIHILCMRSHTHTKPHVRCFMCTTSHVYMYIRCICIFLCPRLRFCICTTSPTWHFFFWFTDLRHGFSLYICTCPRAHAHTLARVRACTRAHARGYVHVHTARHR